MNRSVALLTVALSLLGFAAAPVRADIFSNTVVAAADATALDKDPLTYFPSLDLRTGKFTDGSSNQTLFFKTYLKFDIGSYRYFPAYGQNFTATLSLYYWEGLFSSPPVALYVYGITANPFVGPGDNWQESNQWPNSIDHNYLAWNGQPIPLGEPVLLGTIHQSTLDQHPNALVSCNLSMPWILSEFQGDQVLTLLLMGDEAGPEGVMSFRSLDWLGSEPENVPQLILTYEFTPVPIPLPGSLLLLGSGLLGLAGWGKFRKG